MLEEITATITGTVQNVMFRDFVQKHARELSLVGTVANISDGSVEVVAQGMPEALKVFIERLHEGSVLAQVKSVSVVWRSAPQRFDDFHILHQP